MDYSRISYIVSRYLENSLNEAERLEFEQMLQNGAYHDALLAAFDEQAEDLDLAIAQDETLLPILQAALASDRPPRRVQSRRWWRMAAAAAILAFIACGILWVTHKKTVPPAIDVAATQDIAPGKPGAILTLSDGSELVLDSLGNGVIGQQNGAQLVLANAQLAYRPSDTGAGTVSYNTIATPNGRQFRVVLSDGTQVWLNAASSLTYPAAFGSGERLVTVKGEAYFEVAPDAGRPFRVNANNKANITVLGTHFNVNAYDNEKTLAATLLEGSVRVSAQATGKGHAGEVVLRPGQQAQVSNASAGGPNIRVKERVDIDQVIAWKNGLFSFEGLAFADFMRQLERWYDIEVIYENGIPDIAFEGEMTRDVSLNGLLTILGRSGVKFRLEGRQLIVEP